MENLIKFIMLLQETVDEYPYDLPRETSDIKIQMKNQTTLKLLNEFKNDVMMKIILKIKDDEALKIKDIIPDKLKELDGWVRYFFLCSNIFLIKFI